MPQFRRKPIAVEAKPLSWETCNEIVTWVGESVKTVTVNARTGVVRIKIKTLHGCVDATNGDFVIRSPAGDFYPCAADVFHKLHDQMEREA